MKLKLPYLILAFILCIHTSYAQMTVNSGFTPLEYVQELVGPGITVSNVVMTNNSEIKLEFLMVKIQILDLIQEWLWRQVL